MKISLFLSAFVLLAGANLALGANNPWPKEPRDFRGVPFGASEAEASSKIPSLGNCRNNEILGRLCLDPGYQVGEISFVKNGFVFNDDKLVSVYVNFKSKDYDKIKSLYVEIYGEPKEIKKEKVNTEDGMEYDNEIMTWRGNNIELHVEKYSRNIKDGIVVYSNIRFLDGLGERNRNKGSMGR